MIRRPPTAGAWPHVWFTRWDVETPTSGGQLRSYHLARGIAEAKPLTLLAPSEAAAGGSPYPSLRGIVDLRHYKRVGLSRLRTPTLINPATRSTLSHVLLAICRDLACKGPGPGTRWVVCDGAYVARPLLRLAQRAGADLVYCSHNSEDDVWRTGHLPLSPVLAEMEPTRAARGLLGLAGLRG